ncbi:MAG TPA: protein kinase [Candidatus Polarisedimenticolia bacterium]|nr:protein kinase [Candidatus Polarisedimenticolia bacterium]
MVGQSISHYKITDKLGAGGMGVVYKALDVKLERTVALKFLPTDVAVSKRDKQSLLREARAASALDHPNIGVIHGIEESEDRQLFIVMGYYEGETLAQKLSRGVVPVRESLDLAIQIARGLSSAHARNIVHRDIKPSNIIITDEKVAKIVDFGLARVVTTISATQSISSTGTLPYMAPEQILGEAIDQRCDIWALGLILVQMITGSHPFLRPNQGAMTFAILNQPPAALEVVPKAVHPIAYRALSKKPEGRYPAADEMLRDLEAALAEITSSPTPAEEPTHTRSVDARELKQYMQNASTPSWTTGNPRKFRRLLVASVGVVLATFALSFLPPVRQRFAGLAYAGSEKHIAVLPIANSANDAEFGPVAEGLMDSLTNELSNLEAAQQSLWVVPASIVRSRKVNDPTSAFRELGATMVVQGSLRRKGSGVQLTVVLIDAKRLRQIGSAELEDRSGDLAALQNQAVAGLARMMRVKSSEASQTPAGNVAPGTYESYLKALAYLQRYDKPGNPDLAISALTSAVQKNPRFALGYATLGEAYRLKFLMDHHPAWVDQAFANCRTALQLDDRLPAVHVTLGHLQMTLGKHDLALQEFQKALGINPRDASALIGLANVYEKMGRNSEAEANYQRAIALRPDYWEGYSVLGAFYGRQKRVQDSLAQYRRVLELTPDSPEGYSDLGAEYMELNDSQANSAAEAAFQKSIQLVPNYQAYANLGWLYKSQKRYAESAAATRKALELNDKDWRVWANLQLAYTLLKDDEKMRSARAKTLSLLEQYASVNSQEAPVQSMLSTYYAEDKLREKALTSANAALALAPKDPDVLADLAETYDDLGDRKSAIQYARDSLKNGYTLTDLQERPALQGLLADPSFRARGKQ